MTTNREEGAAVLVRSALPSDSGFVRLFEELYDPALVFDRTDGQILAANEAAILLLGYAPEELAALTPSDIHPHEIPRLEAFLAAVQAHGRWVGDDLSCRTKQGRHVPAEIRASAIELDGRHCILAIVRDRRQDRLARLGGSVRRLMHDLRNTLATAQLVADGLASHPDRLVAQRADAITRSIERVVSMCRAALSVGQTVEPAPRRERFLLVDVVGEVVASIGPREAIGAEVALVRGNRAVVDADFDQLYRILLNLCRNAIDAGADRVTVTGVNRGGDVVIEIVDNGPGLPEAVRAELFSEKGFSSSGGAGLGLMIAAELAANHGGRLELADTGPHGTRFRLVLPTEVAEAD
jgi:PAS domain S-box-containing protein